MKCFRLPKSVFYLTLLVLILSLLVLGGCGTQTTPLPKPEPNQGNNAPAKTAKNAVVPNMVIGYYENPWPNTPDTVGSFPSMKSFGKSMSAVAPFWYRANEDGELDSKESKLVYDAAKNMNLKIYPLVTNIPKATESILGDPAIRTKLTDNIVKLVKEKKFDGVNIDFELLAPKHRDNLTAFMQELYPKMAAINKTVIISVFPQVEVAEDVSGAYNYPELAKNADFLQIMTYDNHWSTSEPGPIAPIDWYEKNIKHAIEQAGGANKIIVGISAYGYDWSKGKGETVTYLDAITRAERNGVGILYDEKAQAPHFKYENHEVWFENAKSAEAKLNVIQKYNPAGIAIWRLGQEQPEIWPLIEQKFPKGKTPAVSGNSPAGNSIWQNLMPGE